MVKTSVFSFFQKLLFRLRYRNRCNIVLDGRLKHVEFVIKGEGHNLIFSSGCRLSNVKIYVIGSCNTIIIHKEVGMYGGELWIEDSGNVIEIGEKTTIENAHLAVTGKEKCIKIGDDCLLSNAITLRTGDSHAIIDQTSAEKINEEEDVIINSHVWLGSGVTILKGVVIGRDSVVGAKSLVTHSFGNFLLIAGIPAKVIREKISWSRQRFIKS